MNLQKRIRSRKQKDKFNSPDFFKALAAMVKMYGEKNWADVARALNDIYGYNIKNSTAAAKWRSINPSFERRSFNLREMIELWFIVQENKASMPKVVEVYQEKGLRFFKDELWNRYRNLYKKTVLTVFKFCDLESL